MNNVVYLQWVQDAAAAHWEHFALAEERASIAWVALRHEIEYEAPAFAGEALVARTWVERWTGVTSERHTEIVRSEDGARLERARTTWCAVAPDTGRPRRLGRALCDRFASEGSEPEGVDGGDEASPRS